MLTRCIMCIGWTEADHCTMGESMTVNECNSWTPVLNESLDC